MQLDLGIRLLHSAALAVALLGVFLGIAASYHTVAANYAVPEIIPQLNSGILANYTAGAVLVARIDSFHRSESFF